MKLRNSKKVLLKIAFLFLLLVMSKSIAYSQTTSSDSLKCFTYSEARKIITDLRQLPIKDSVIVRLDSINTINDTIINAQSVKIGTFRNDLFQKDLKIAKQKANRKIYFIFGILLGFSTQLIF